MADNNQDINQLLKVRREKLAELQEQGNDPFMTATNTLPTDLCLS